MLMNRRQAIGVSLALPLGMTLRGAAPSERIRHASFGAGGMALTDLKALASHAKIDIAAICDVDSVRLGECLKLFPNAKGYADWRELLDKEKLDSVNVSTPDHMHAPIAMSAMNRGLAVYCQKPLTHTLHEARALTKAAADKKLVTQMGIQIHSHEAHRTVVKLVQSGVVGKITQVVSWMGKGWGDPHPLPMVMNQPPATLQWDFWVGVAGKRVFIADNYYHPANWRKRLDFGTGTLGDMGCHILDPIFESLELTAPTQAICLEGGIKYTNWGLDNKVQWTFPGTKYTSDAITLTWTDGAAKRDEELFKKYGVEKPGSAGTLYIGEKGAIFSPYIGLPSLLPKEQFAEVKIEKVPAVNHWHQYLDAVRGQGACGAPFAFAGPLTEAVLVGCMAERFPNQKLEWNAKELKVTNLAQANQFIRKEYRKGWEVQGL